MPDFTLVQWLAIWVIVAVVASPFIGNLLYKLRTRREFQALLESERRRVRLAKLLDLADEYEAAETDKQRSQTYRKAIGLGFTDGPFMLDEPTHPHPKDAA